MQQQVTLQLNTKTVVSLIVGLAIAVPATFALTLALMVPRVANADTTQTSNSNPTFSMPAGYALVPAGSGGVCPGGTASGSGVVGVPLAFGSVLPSNYTSTTTQTSTTTNYKNSFNTDNSDNSDNSNNSTNDSNNGNGSGNNSNNPTSTIVTTTTTTNTDNSNNSINTDNSVTDSNNGNGSGNNDNSDAVIVSVVDSLNDNFSNNTATIPFP